MAEIAFSAAQPLATEAKLICAVEGKETEYEPELGKLVKAIWSKQRRLKAEEISVSVGT
jgi:hypothetical protein